MCLKIQNISFNKQCQQKVYKVVELNNGEMNSPYKLFEWKIGHNVSSRETLELNDDEDYDGVVHKGFHFFVNVMDAFHDIHYMNDIRNYCTTFAVLECIVDPENYVAEGIFEGIPFYEVPDAKCVVYTKCEVRRILYKVESTLS